MSHHDDFVRRVESYLDDYEGHTPMPEAIRTRVRAMLPTIKQGGPHRGPQRFGTMTLHVPAPARYGLVAAALLGAVVLGASVFSGGRGAGGSADPSAQPSPAPSDAETAGPTPAGAGAVSLLEAPTDGNLPPGRYFLDLDAYPGRIEFEVPSGWWHFWPGATREASDTHAILVDSLDTGATSGSAWGLSFTIVGEVQVDPCDREAGTMDPSVTASAESLATAFSSWPDLPATSVEDVTIGGYAGKRVELNTASSQCLSRLFTTPAGYTFEIQRARAATAPPPEQFTFLDVEGSVLTIWTTDYPGTNYFEMDGGASFDPQAHADDQVELRGILDSIVIQGRPAASN